MPDYSVWMLWESNLSLTGGVTLDGITQGDGSHLVGEYLTINSTTTQEVFVSDNETSFDDNDGNQRLNGAQTIDGITYADNSIIEAEYQIVVEDESTGIQYTIIGINIVSDSPPFGTVEGIGFVGSVPPVGAPLRIISASEGPGSSGEDAIDETLVIPYCVNENTKVLTERGPLPVQDLQPGDRIPTADGTTATLRRVFSTSVSPNDIADNPKLRPIRISAGALGQSLPERDLLVSRQHRVLVSSKIAERMFGQSDVLVAAIKLIDLPGIFIDDSITSPRYFHLLFDKHEVIFTEGAPTESLFTGREAMKSMPPAAREEILTLFPGLADQSRTPSAARPIPSNGQQKRLVIRHLKNGKAPLERYTSANHPDL